MILYVYPMCVLGQKGIVSRIPKIITEYQKMNMFNGQQQTDCHVKKCFGMLFFDQRFWIILSVSTNCPILGSKKSSIQYLLMNILDGFADDGSCYQPCRRMKFNSRRTRIDPRDDRIGIFIQLEEKVSVRETKFAIDGITLLTRIGGLIGVGKEFLWISVITCGLLKFTFHYR